MSPAAPRDPSRYSCGAGGQSGGGKMSPGPMHRKERPKTTEGTPSPQPPDSPKMSPGLRVLRKAKSFRDELKIKIVRRATSVPRHEGKVIPSSPTPTVRQRMSRLTRPLSRSSDDGDDKRKSNSHQQQQNHTSHNHQNNHNHQRHQRDKHADRHTSPRKDKNHHNQGQHKVTKATGSGEGEGQPVKRKSLTRGMSFHEGKKIDKHELEIERLENSSRKVHQALLFTEKVVTTGSIQQLSGSATVVLETVNEFHHLLSHYTINNDSTILTSSWHQVHQSLAELIHWADFMLLQGDSTAINKHAADAYIISVRDALQKLLRVTVDKMRQRSLQPVIHVSGAANSGLSAVLADNPVTNTNPLPVAVKRRSTVHVDGECLTPDTPLPLSAREMSILRDTQNLEATTLKVPPSSGATTAASTGVTLRHNNSSSSSRPASSSSATNRLSRSCDDILVDSTTAGGGGAGGGGAGVGVVDVDVGGLSGDEAGVSGDEALASPPPPKPHKPPLPHNVEALLRRKGTEGTSPHSSPPPGIPTSLTSDNISAPPGYTPPPALPNKKKYSLPEKSELITTTVQPDLLKLHMDLHYPTHLHGAHTNSNVHTRNTLDSDSTPSSRLSGSSVSTDDMCESARLSTVSASQHDTQARTHVSQTRLTLSNSNTSDSVQNVRSVCRLSHYDNYNMQGTVVNGDVESSSITRKALFAGDDQVSDVMSVSSATVSSSVTSSASNSVASSVTTSHALDTSHNNDLDHHVVHNRHLLGGLETRPPALPVKRGSSMKKPQSNSSSAKESNSPRILRKKCTFKDPPSSNEQDSRPQQAHVTFRVPSTYDNVSDDESPAGVGATGGSSGGNGSKFGGSGTELRRTGSGGRCPGRSFRDLQKRSYSIAVSSNTHTTASGAIEERIVRFEDSSQVDYLHGDDPSSPPPLPPKKKIVNAYMEIFGASRPMLPSDLGARGGRHSVHSVNFYEKERYQHQIGWYDICNGLHRAGTMPAKHPGRITSATSIESTGSSTCTGSSTTTNARHQRISDTTSADTGSTEDVVSLASVTSSSTDDTVLLPAVGSGGGAGVVAATPGGHDPHRHHHHHNVTSEVDVVVDDMSLVPPHRRSEPLNTAGSLDEGSLVNMRHSAPNTTPTDRPCVRLRQHNTIDMDETNSHSTSSDQVDSGVLGCSRMLGGSDSKEAQQRECDPQEDKDYAELCTLDEIDVSRVITRRDSTEGGDTNGIVGGTVDALLVQATLTSKTDFMYQEAFLTTYRTFVSPRSLLDKLLYRYKRMTTVHKEKMARNTFSLIIRVIDDLSMEVDSDMLEVLMQLVYELLCAGELMLARILRTKVLEKCRVREQLIAEAQNPMLLPNYQLSAKQYSLKSLKSVHIAEQMTLLDCELFHKIELPEVLLWAHKQSEEKSPNLTKFTEHFNKVSYWCRTRILELEEPKEREHCLVKFIKVMKHLRKLNNFNSYLAILSALDSAPVRRLEWPKQNLEVLQEFCQLIDSSSSFRAYRTALSETEPPCIPYIGLVLQDLTFVHVGNPDHTADGEVNFAKCWQQFQILDNMRRFKNSHYKKLSKNSKILSYFNNFDNYLSEESLWQISETIKPRPTRKKTPAIGLINHQNQA